MVSRGISVAHYGLRDWLAQRVTAIVMTVYTVLLVVEVLSGPKIDYSSWRMLFAPQWMKLATLLFLVSLYVHAWVGVRNIFMDYIKNNGLRLALHVLAIAWLVACAGWSVQILWGVR